jgi:hypothetical protein
MTERHSCIRDDGGTPNRRCYACEDEEAKVPLQLVRPMDMRRELRAYLDGLTITSENIGEIRGRLFMPWKSLWNGLVRDETAARENR